MPYLVLFSFVPTPRSLFCILPTPFLKSTPPTFRFPRFIVSYISSLLAPSTSPLPPALHILFSSTFRIIFCFPLNPLFPLLFLLILFASFIFFFSTPLPYTFSSLLSLPNMEIVCATSRHDQVWDNSTDRIVGASRFYAVGLLAEHRPLDGCL